MIIYFTGMRSRDEIKQDALFRATVKLVNEIGFASSSVAKIAKQAGISPATVYIYFKNKEDLLVSTYMDIKRDFCGAMLKDFDGNKPIRDIFRKVWFNLFAHISERPADFRFSEQFANSPYADRIDRDEIDRLLMPLIQTMKKGIAQKIIKDVDFDILVAFILYPIFSLSNPKLCGGFNPAEKNIETGFRLAWDAIKK
jgi:AcrR family transcriptional regulator